MDSFPSCASLAPIYAQKPALSSYESFLRAETRHCRETATKLACWLDLEPFSGQSVVLCQALKKGSGINSQMAQRALRTIGS